MVRIEAQIDWIGIPTDRDIESVLRGFDVFGRIVIWDLPVAVEGDTNLAVLGGLELVAIDLDGVCVR